MTARPVDEHSSFIIGRKGDDSGNLKECLRKTARKYVVDAFIYKPYYKNVELHIFQDTSQRQGPSWETRPLGPFHPSRIGDLHILLTRGGAIGWNLPEERCGPVLMGSTVSEVDGKMSLLDQEELLQES
jgi:hypothetical protein